MTPSGLPTWGRVGIGILAEVGVLRLCLRARPGGVPAWRDRRRRRLAARGPGGVSRLNCPRWSSREAGHGRACRDLRLAHGVSTRARPGARPARPARALPGWSSREAGHGRACRDPRLGHGVSTRARPGARPARPARALGGRAARPATAERVENRCGSVTGSRHGLAQGLARLDQRERCPRWSSREAGHGRGCRDPRLGHGVSTRARPGLARLDQRERCPGWSSREAGHGRGCRDRGSVTGSRRGLAQGLARLDQRERCPRWSSREAGHGRACRDRCSSVTGSRHGLAQGLARLDQRERCPGGRAVRPATAERVETAAVGHRGLDTGSPRGSPGSTSESAAARSLVGLNREAGPAARACSIPAESAAARSRGLDTQCQCGGLPLRGWRLGPGRRVTHLDTDAAPCWRGLSIARSVHGDRGRAGRVTS